MTTTTQLTHPQLVAALAKPPVSIIRTLTEANVNLWHAATGVSGECGELLELISSYRPGHTFDHNNLIEELGDLEFYIQMIRAEVGLERVDVAETCAEMQISPDMPLQHAVSATIYGAMILDTIKKVAIYNKPFDGDMIGALDVQLLRLDIALGALMLCFGVRRETTLAMNIAKLSKRYASLSYSDQQAQERADKHPRTSDMDDIVRAETGENT